jgi:hypothetical protein
LSWIIVPPESPSPISIQPIVSVPQQARNVELFRTAGQTVAAVGAAMAAPSGEPVTGILEHAIAILPKARHLVADRQIPQP